MRSLLGWEKGLHPSPSGRGTEGEGNMSESFLNGHALSVAVFVWISAQRLKSSKMVFSSLKRRDGYAQGRHEGRASVGSHRRFMHHARRVSRVFDAGDDALRRDDGAQDGWTA